ncbi:hypothetical protein PVAP13_6NG069430 [Panicum virgatum]|uniref:Uncharacterized protein n=1 Tax=Panicum virgatum TaxID=38727 RepID=A0A8T0QV94_PANVG|nr:hypothetical protein PVAP13_6NG069430 [Panicum virgatum]
MLRNRDGRQQSRGAAGAGGRAQTARGRAAGDSRGRARLADGRPVTPQQADPRRAESGRPRPRRTAATGGGPVGTDAATGGRRNWWTGDETGLRRAAPAREPRRVAAKREDGGPQLADPRRRMAAGRPAAEQWILGGMSYP